jgi:signal transduction histidine kinase
LGQAGAPPQPVSVEASREDDRVVITVGDRRPGIPEGKRGRVLERFVRLESARSRPGFGLGLSLVSAVARLHGGSVRLDDNAPGLKAVLSLPLRSSNPPPAAGEGGLGRSPSRERGQIAEAAFPSPDPA